MSLLMVDDPTHTGKGTPRQMPRAWAMRLLYDEGRGLPIGEIARQYGTTYQMAYKSINPKRLNARDPRSTARKELTPDRLKKLTKQQLINGQDVSNTALDNDPSLVKRVEAYQGELDRRFPGWYDDLPPRKKR